MTPKEKLAWFSLAAFVLFFVLSMGIGAYWIGRLAGLAEERETEFQVQRVLFGIIVALENGDSENAKQALTLCSGALREHGELRSKQLKEAADNLAKPQQKSCETKRRSPDE